MLTPYQPAEDGVSPGIFNTRVRGHHLALAGVVAQKVPYRFKATFTENFGTYPNPLPLIPWQLSMALETDITKHATRLPVTFSVGLYGDVGKLYQNSAGLTFRVLYGGTHRF